MNQDIDNQIGGYEWDYTRCPRCGGDADNGHDRCYPPNAYVCTKCESAAASPTGCQHVPAVGGGSDDLASVASQHKPTPDGGDGLTSLKRIDVSHQCSPAYTTEADIEAMAHMLWCNAYPELKRKADMADELAGALEKCERALKHCSNQSTQDGYNAAREALTKYRGTK